MPKHGPTLADVYLKTTRARVHLEALRSELDAFRKTNPCRVFRKENHKLGRYEIRVKTEDTPDHIPLIVGDLLYCLRSSLDQLTWSLAKLTTGYPRETQFPIFDAFNAKTRKRFAAYTLGVPPRAAKLIESLQPYHRADPSTHLLSQLNRLGNIDKHRRIPVHGDEVIFNFPKMPRALVTALKFDHDQHMVSVPLALKDQMEVAPMAAFRVIFGDSVEGVSCDFAGIECIYEFVANSVLPRFGPFFKSKRLSNPWNPLGITGMSTPPSDRQYLKNSPTIPLVARWFVRWHSCCEIASRQELTGRRRTAMTGIVRPYSESNAMG